MVMTTFQSVSQLRCLLGEAGCSHQDSPERTGIADDVLAKRDSE